MLAGDISAPVTATSTSSCSTSDSKADSTAGRDAILRVFPQGLNEKLATAVTIRTSHQLERRLDVQGKLDAFKSGIPHRCPMSTGAGAETGYGFYSDALVQAVSEALGMTMEGARSWLDKSEDDFKSLLTVEKLRPLGQGIPRQPAPEPPHHLPGGRGRPVHRPRTPTYVQPSDHHREPGYSLRRAGPGPWSPLRRTSTPSWRRCVLPGANDFSKIQGRFRTAVALQRQRRRGDPEAPAQQDRMGPVWPSAESTRDQGRHPQKPSSASATSA